MYLFSIDQVRRYLAECLFEENSVFSRARRWNAGLRRAAEWLTDDQHGIAQSVERTGARPYEDRQPEIDELFRTIRRLSQTQHTKCAKCGVDRHTPLRRDDMGGYVCLTCIDEELTARKVKGQWPPCDPKLLTDPTTVQSKLDFARRNLRQAEGTIAQQHERIKALQMEAVCKDTTIKHVERKLAEREQEVVELRMNLAGQTRATERANSLYESTFRQLQDIRTKHDELVRQQARDRQITEEMTRKLAEAMQYRLLGEMMSPHGKGMTNGG